MIHVFPEEISAKCSLITASIPPTILGMSDFGFQWEGKPEVAHMKVEFLSRHSFINKFVSTWLVIYPR